jgi:hypothetical protein
MKIGMNGQVKNIEESLWNFRCAVKFKGQINVEACESIQLHMALGLQPVYEFDSEIHAYASSL